MSTELSTVIVLPLDFSCTVLNDNRLLSNIYFIKLGINPIWDDSNNIGFGFQRIKYLADHVLHNSLFVSNKDQLKAQLDLLDTNLVCLPDEIYDVYVGSILMAKFQTVTNKYFEIEYLTIASLLGDQVQYNIMSPYESDLDIDGDHWWNKDNIWTGSKTAGSWEELNLSEGPKFKPVVIKGGLSEN